MIPRPLLEQAAFWCTFGSASLTVVSIAASQILLGTAILLVIVSRMPLRFPPIGIPLTLFVTGTLLSLMLSDHPAAGLPQVRKFFVYLILLVVMTTFREARQIRWLVWSWLAVGSIAAARSLFQFGQKYGAAATRGSDFYRDYVGERITGFFSHWMTFSGVMMIIVLMGLAFLLWGRPSSGERQLTLFALPLCCAAIVLAMTRGIWIGTAAGIVFLLWGWKRWTVLGVPVVLAGVLAVNPVDLRTRITSLIRPRGTLDSNQHRLVTWRTGLEMVKAHPWLGVGPEQVAVQFDRFIPPDISRPLPVGWYGHLHNNYLQYAAERGLPTLAMLLWMIFRILRDWWRAPPAWFRQGGLAALGGTLITGFFELNLGDSEVLLMTLALVSAVYAAMQSPREEQT